MKTKTRTLTEQELEIMKVVWEKKTATVREIYEALRERKTVAYTTVMTTLGRLADKGLLRRIEDQPAHHYSAVVSRDQYARSTVKSVVDWLLGHFPDPAVASFIDRVAKDDEDVIDRVGGSGRHPSSRR